MLRLKPRQRAALGETLRDLANLGAAALVFGQFIGQQPLSWVLMLAGAGIWVGFVSVALVMEG
jgi:hypothetical protein